MGRFTKSRTNGMIIGKKMFCSKEGHQGKKYVKKGKKVKKKLALQHRMKQGLEARQCYM